MGKRMNIQLLLLEEIKKLAVINTHSHHLPDELQASVDLTYLLSSSYTVWMSPPPDINNREEVQAYLLKYKCNTYYRWLFASLEELYGFEVTADNFPAINQAIITAYQSPSYHLEVLKHKCRFSRIINERQPNPGFNLNHPELFSPSFRCDSYFSGYIQHKPDPNGFYAYS